MRIYSATVASLITAAMTEHVLVAHDEFFGGVFLGKPRREVTTPTNRSARTEQDTLGLVHHAAKLHVCVESPLRVIRGEPEVLHSEPSAHAERTLGSEHTQTVHDQFNAVNVMISRRILDFGIEICSIAGFEAHAEPTPMLRAY